MLLFKYSTQQLPTLQEIKIYRKIMINDSKKISVPVQTRRKYVGIKNMRGNWKRSLCVGYRSIKMGSRPLGGDYVCLWPKITTIHKKMKPKRRNLSHTSASIGKRIWKIYEIQYTSSVSIRKSKVSEQPRFPKAAHGRSSESFKGRIIHWIFIIFFFALVMRSTITASNLAVCYISFLQLLFSSIYSHIIHYIIHIQGSVLYALSPANNGHWTEHLQ